MEPLGGKNDSKKSSARNYVFRAGRHDGPGLGQRENHQKPIAVKIKPDIVLKNLVVTRLSGDASGERIRIRAVVFNPVEMTSTGPFQVRISVRLPSGLYFRIGEETVAGLTNKGAIGQGPLENG